MSTAQPITGAWRIVDMECWAQADADCLGPAHFTFGEEGFGNFRFVVVEGDMDCQFGERDGKPLVEFSWIGSDDADPASGRGWAVVDGDVMTGRIFIHRGDNSAFTAKRSVDMEPSRRKSRRRR